MPPIQTLAQFYAAMRRTRDIRTQLTGNYLRNAVAAGEPIQQLKKILAALQRIPRTDQGYRLQLDNASIVLNLDYELTELEKDILFLERGETAFSAYLTRLHPTLTEQQTPALALLGTVKIRNFITDRDGTVNNYCGRYASSIQSIYNAVYLSRFIRRCTLNTVILTSAPLDNIGLTDLSIMPDNLCIYAGSKGREYLDREQRRCRFPIDATQQQRLDELNTTLSAFVHRPEYIGFSLIGSGLQFKFGQTTIARQDIARSIPEQQSLNFLAEIRRMVSRLDPDGETFRIEDTGKDIEIILTVKNTGENSGRKDFDKGDGVAFLNEDAGLRIETGPNLICGDTASDLPMLQTAAGRCPQTYGIFVTTDTGLADRARTICPNTIIVSTPDILISILNRLALEHQGNTN